MFESTKTAIPIRFHRGDESEMPLGCSKVGGHPDLPFGVEWPTNKGEPLEFRCQINFAETRDFDKERVLPSSGLALFFVDHSSWGFDPDHRTGRKVFFFEAVPPLQRRNTGEESFIPGYDPLRLSFGPIGPAIESNHCRDYCGQMLGDRAIGYQEGDPKVQSQLASNGVCFGDEEEADPRTPELLKGIGDWLYLLQIDDSISALFFLIKKEDLGQCTFDNVWCCQQTT